VKVLKKVWALTVDRLSKKVTDKGIFGIFVPVRNRFGSS
jgi:hypothetical protein